MPSFHYFPPLRPQATLSPPTSVSIQLSALLSVPLEEDHQVTMILFLGLARVAKVFVGQGL